MPDLIYEYGERYRDSAFICKYWHKVNGTTPDYYHINAKHHYYKIPDNRNGYHPIIDDSAYVGFIPFDLNGPAEPISGELKKPMVAGEKYVISFFYRFGGAGCYYYLDKIDAYISKNIDYFSIQKPFPGYREIMESAQIKANVNFIDTLNNDGKWHKMRGYFMAKGGEKYISLGIFYEGKKLLTLMDKHLSNNLIADENQENELRFLKKHEKHLFIHKNPNYMPIIDHHHLEISYLSKDSTTHHKIHQKDTYYFIDDVTVKKVESDLK